MSGLGTSPRSWRRTGRFPGPTCIDSRRDSSWRHRRSKFRQRPRRALLRRFRPPGPSLRRRYRRLRPGLRPTRSPRRPPEFRRCLPAAPLRPRSRRPIHRRTTPAPVERTPVGAARSSSDFVPSVHSILVARRIRSHQRWTSGGSHEGMESLRDSTCQRGLPELRNAIRHELVHVPGLVKCRSSGLPHHASWSSTSSPRRARRVARSPAAIRSRSTRWSGELVDAGIRRPELRRRHD
jgi:hypothetical protein